MVTQTRTSSELRQHIPWSWVLGLGVTLQVNLPDMYARTARIRSPPTSTATSNNLRHSTNLHLLIFGCGGRVSYGGRGHKKGAWGCHRWLAAPPPPPPPQFGPSDEVIPGVGETTACFQGVCLAFSKSRGSTCCLARFHSQSQPTSNSCMTCRNTTEHITRHRTGYRERRRTRCENTNKQQGNTHRDIEFFARALKLSGRTVGLQIKCAVHAFVQSRRSEQMDKIDRQNKSHTVLAMSRWGCFLGNGGGGRAASHFRILRHGY